MRKTILITGCSGQLGYRLRDDLSDHFNIIPTYRKHKDKNKKLCLINKKDFEYIFSIYRPDIVINCAALTDVDYCEDNKEHCHDVNVRGLSRLLSFSDINTKIIHISSDYVFDGLTGNYDENNMTYPVNYYGKSKLESENALIGSNKKYIIFRASMLFDNNNGNNFFTWVLDNLKKNKKMKVATDILSNPTWIPSFSNIIMRSIYLNLSGIFHYGSDQSISRFDFAQLIAKQFNYSDKLIIPVTSDAIDFKAKRPKNTGLISDKISKCVDVDTDNIDYILKIINRV